MEKKHKWLNYILPALGRGLGVGFFFSFFLISSCHREQASLSEAELARRDSLALHVAVMPVADCLPLYYAQSMGLFDKEQLDVRLHSFNSTADCDTALLNRVCQVAYTDLFRLRAHNICDSAHVLALLDGRLYLVSARGKRIRSTKHLKERMVALNRHSTADYWSDIIVEEAGLQPSDIYRPQINDIRLRTTMLIDELVDAAILPEPYASWAALKGHRIIAKTDSLPLPVACFALGDSLQRDAHRRQQMTKLLKVYRTAEQALQQEVCTDSLRSLFVRQYSLPDEVADSLALRQPFASCSNKATQASQKVERSLLTSHFSLSTAFGIVEKWWTKRHSYN